MSHSRLRRKAYDRVVTMPRWAKFVALFVLAALLSAPGAALVACLDMQMEGPQAESCPAHAMHVPTPKVQEATKACCSFQGPSVPAKRAELRAADNLTAVLHVTVAVMPQLNAETVLPAATSLASRSAPQHFFVLLI